MIEKKLDDGWRWEPTMTTIESIRINRVGSLVYIPDCKMVSFEYEFELEND
jgi:hypothetical protein